MILLRKIFKKLIIFFYKIFHLKKFRKVILFGIPKIIEYKNVYFGEKVRINDNVFIHAAEKVIIGENTTLSYGTTILTTGYDLSNYNNYINKIHKSNKIEIGKNVWVCANVTILPGVTINDDVVIAAGSVVSDNLLEKRAIYGGIPARKIKNF